MKKFLLTLILTITSVSFSQEFETGKIGVYLSDAGRFRIFAPDLLTRQIDRSSLLFGVSEEAVYSYNADADSMIAVANVENPELSDYELYGVADNGWSDLPPDIESEMHVYGWENEGYVIAKFIVKNVESENMNGYLGLEIIPQVDNEYGLESVKAEGEVVTIWRPTNITYPTTTYTGYKLLSQEMVTMNVIDWYDGYDTLDVEIYNWMTSKEIDPTFASGSDGTVIFIGTDEVSIAPSSGVEFYVAVAVSESKNEMLSFIAAAEEKYNSLITKVEKNDNLLPSAFKVYQNYPNPFNPNTIISFDIPTESFVKLEIFNGIGQLIQTAVDQNLSQGSYNYEFNAENLSSGIYFYSMTYNGKIITKKMSLTK